MDSASLTTTPLATCQQEKSASGHACCDPRDRVPAALAGVALGLAVALRLLTLPLREFGVFCITPEKVYAAGGERMAVMRDRTIAR